VPGVRDASRPVPGLDRSAVLRRVLAHGVGEGGPVTASLRGRACALTRPIRMTLPYLSCHRCRAQVLTTDALGRWTAPTFVGPVFPGVDLGAETLVCGWCARLDDCPHLFRPFVPGMAEFLPGCASALPAREAFDLLLAAGASLHDLDLPPVARVDGL